LCLFFIFNKDYNLEIFFAWRTEKNRLVNIQELVLSSSHIAHISGVGLRGLYNLVRLDLSHNLLAAVPSQALGLTAQLRDLSLAYNPLGELEVHAQTSFYQENLAFCFQLCSVMQSSLTAESDLADFLCYVWRRRWVDLGGLYLIVCKNYNSLTCLIVFFAIFNFDNI
jgi:Leucine-rich repeat (LRR) protein